MGTAASPHCEMFACCGKGRVETSAGGQSESPRIPVEFEGVETANVTAAEEERGDVSFGSLFLFHRAQDSMKSHQVATPCLLELPNETDGSKDGSQHLSDLLRMVQKEQEELESATLTEHSKLQSEREELEREKRSISLLISVPPRHRSPPHTDSQPSFVWSTLESKASKPSLTERKDSNSSFKQKRGRVQRFQSSPHKGKP